MHDPRAGFIMPNAWDAGSARILLDEGFEAIGTTSAGIAFSLGKPDFDVPDPNAGVTREEMFARIRQITDSTNAPVNADLESGYGREPEDVAETVRLAIEIGLAGGNIEDHDAHSGGQYDEQLSVERIRAARAAIEAAGTAFVLTAKIDAFVTSSGNPVAACIRRGNLFREAGADCIYPLLPTIDEATIKRLLREIPGPLNIVLGWGEVTLNAHQLLDAGVTRVSLGGSVARSTLGFVRRAARELRDSGTLQFAADQIPQRELNALFAPGADRKS